MNPAYMRWIVKYLIKKLFLSYQELKTCNIEGVIKVVKETLTI